MKHGYNTFSPPHKPRSEEMATIRLFCGHSDVSMPSSVTIGGSFSCDVHACTVRTNHIQH